LVAEYTTTVPTNPQTSYLTTDTLGSPRINTDAFGLVKARHDYLPFGEEIIGLGNRTSSNGYQADDIRQKFTQYERDVESGLDFAQARYYSSQHGRFASPDTFGGFILNPQTLNLYAYVQNSPLVHADPTGHFAEHIDDLSKNLPRWNEQKTNFENLVWSKVKPLDAKALDIIKGTLPAEIRGQIVLDKDGFISQDAINAINSNDPNFLKLKVMVNDPRVVEVSSATGWSDNKGNSFQFDYKTPDEAVQEMISNGVSPAQANQLKPTKAGTNYLGQTIPPADSSNGNLQVVLADGTGDTSDAPLAERVVTAGHELYGHAYRFFQGVPWQHDNGGPVDTYIYKRVEPQTLKNVLGPTRPTQHCVRNPNRPR
jgi:RHS repeat-associated protein